VSVVVEARRLKCSSALLASFFYAARTLSLSLSKDLLPLIPLDRALFFPVLAVLVQAVLPVVELRYHQGQ